MRKNLFGSFSFASVLVATALVGFDTQIAMACSGGGASSSGVSHGSSLGSRSVTVCVGSSGGSAGSSSTQTITKTVRVKVAEKPKPPPPKAKPKAKVVAHPAPKPEAVPVQVSCPSAGVMASMPRSADAAERWVESICSPAPKTVSAPKPAPKVSAKSRYETKTITETITIETPGFSYTDNDAVQFYPNALRAIMTPDKVLAIGAAASFSSNPTAHYGSSTVLGKQAQVHFVPQQSGWSFSDGVSKSGADTSRSFGTAGKYQAVAWVEYQVNYRLVGETTWQEVAGLLSVESNTLEVLVGASYLKADQKSQGALLVGEDCRFRSSAFGCELLGN